MVYQLENLASIVQKYKKATMTFICPKAHAPLIGSLKNARVIEYDPHDFLIYGAEHARVVNEVLNSSYDFCIMLEKQYTLAHLYIVGISRAHLRVGWDDGDSARFLNIRLVATQREGVSLWERNLETANFLDAKIGDKRWGVKKTTAEEVSKLLGEHGIDGERTLICIDLASLESCYGREWCERLLKTLKQKWPPGQYFAFNGFEGENNGVNIENTSVKVLPPMPVPRAAALMARTNLTITGPGPLLGLVQLSGSKTVPILTHEQAAIYCRKCETVLPALFSEKPGVETIEIAVKNATALIAQKH
jgi:hypothetical protein